MKCRAWVVEKPGRKKGNGERYVRIEAVADAYPREQRDGPIDIKVYEANGNKWPMKRVVFYPEPPESHPDATLCGGDIEATVQAVDEAVMGGTYAQLEIGYKCTRCKHTYHGPDLPTDSDSLSKLLTEYIGSLPEVTA